MNGEITDDGLNSSMGGETTDDACGDTTDEDGVDDVNNNEATDRGMDVHAWETDDPEKNDDDTMNAGSGSTAREETGGRPKQDYAQACENIGGGSAKEQAAGVQAALQYADRGWSDGNGCSNDKNDGFSADLEMHSSAPPTSNGTGSAIPPSPVEVLQMCAQSLTCATLYSHGYPRTIRDSAGACGLRNEASFSRHQGFVECLNI